MMWAMIQEYPVVSILLTPFVLYVLVRVAGLAWHRSKFDSLRRLDDGPDNQSEK